MSNLQAAARLSGRRRPLGHCGIHSRAGPIIRQRAPPSYRQPARPPNFARERNGQEICERSGRNTWWKDPCRAGDNDLIWSGFCRPAGTLACDTEPIQAGAYELKPEFIITVTVEKDQLCIQATGQPKFLALPSSETEFFLKDVEAQISFVRDAAGNVTQMILRQGGGSIPARKIK